MRKRDAQDGGEDTVEKAVEGLAESILREDAEKRKEELVGHQHPGNRFTLLTAT